MRYVVAFLVFVAFWQVIAEVSQGHSEVGHFFARVFGDDGRVRDDAPNWGDVAKKIGELSAERAALRQGLDAEVAPPEPKPRPAPQNN